MNAEGHSKKGKIIERNVLVINPEEAKIVRRIFEISAETGKGGHLIYKQLCEEFGGEILGRPKPKRGPGGERLILPAQPMDGGSINAILKKKIYVGIFIYNSHGLRAAVEASSERKAKKERYAKPQEEWIEVRDESWRIVSDELWAAAKASRVANQSVRKDFGFSNRKAAYALTGLIECGRCGQSFGGKWQRSRNLGFSDKNEYYYYRCRQAMNGAAGCDNKSKIDGAQFELAVIDAVLSRLLDKKFLLDLSGIPYGANGHRLLALYAWHPIAGSAQLSCPWMASPGVSGFSAGLGNPSNRKRKPDRRLQRHGGGRGKRYRMLRFQRFLGPANGMRSTMKVSINASLGVHPCSKCAGTLSDDDFLLCGIQFKPEVVLCFDYRCPNCKFLGRWTVGIISDEDRLAAALGYLKVILREELPARPRRCPVFRRDGNRISDLFNSSDV